MEFHYFPVDALYMGYAPAIFEHARVSLICADLREM